MSGKELDEMVGKEVFGWIKQPNGKWKMQEVGAGTVFGDLPKYSTDDQAAVLVREKMKSHQNHEYFKKELCKPFKKLDPGEETPMMTPTSPRDVCVAALGAVRREEV